MKYRCLVLDHDDTAVNSTKCIHYPCFLETLSILRPGKTISLEDFFKCNFDPGFFKLCTDIYGYTEDEMKFESDYWLKYAFSHTAEFLDGIPEIIKRQKKEGGIICVVSHSSPDFILKDYKTASLPEPDIIFGYNPKEKEKMKPSTFPLTEIMRIFNVDKSEMLVVDDLKPGYDMAANAGVDFAYSGWSPCRIKPIEDFMRMHNVIFPETAKDLYDFLFS